MKTLFVNGDNDIQEFFDYLELPSKFPSLTAYYVTSSTILPEPDFSSVSSSGLPPFDFGDDQAGIEEFSRPIEILMAAFDFADSIEQVVVNLADLEIQADLGNIYPFIAELPANSPIKTQVITDISNDPNISFPPDVPTSGTQHTDKIVYSLDAGRWDIRDTPTWIGANNARGWNSENLNNSFSTAAEPNLEWNANLKPFPSGYRICEILIHGRSQSSQITHIGFRIYHQSGDRSVHSYSYDVNGNQQFDGTVTGNWDSDAETNVTEILRNDDQFWNNDSHRINVDMTNTNFVFDGSGAVVVNLRKGTSNGTLTSTQRVVFDVLMILEKVM